MSQTLQERLRKRHDQLNCNVGGMGAHQKTLQDREAEADLAAHDCWEAADRIDELEACLKAARESVTAWQKDYEALRADNERLRATAKEALINLTHTWRDAGRRRDACIRQLKAILNEPACDATRATDTEKPE